MKLPEKITITYVATYDVARLVDELRSDNRDITKELEISLDDVIEAIIIAYRDMVAEAKGRDFIITDENGEEQ